MTYKIVPTPKFAKNFKKLDPFVRKQIKSYLNRVQIIQEPRVRPWLPIALDNGAIVLVPIVLLSIFRTMN